MVLVKCLVEFVGSLAFSEATIDNNRVSLSIVLCLETSNVNLADKLGVNCLKGSFNKPQSVLGETTSHGLDELVELDHTIVVLIEDCEHALDICLSYLELECEHSSHEFVEVKGS